MFSKNHLILIAVSLCLLAIGKTYCIADDEEHYYSKVKQKDTIHAYETFLEVFPNTKYKEEIHRRMQFLRGESLEGQYQQQIAQNIDNMGENALVTYLESNPDEAVSDRIKRKLISINPGKYDFFKVQRLVRQGDIAPIIRYVKTNKTSYHRKYLIAWINGKLKRHVSITYLGMRIQDVEYTDIPESYELHKSLFTNDFSVLKRDAYIHEEVTKAIVGISVYSSIPESFEMKVQLCAPGLLLKYCLSKVFLIPPQKKRIIELEFQANDWTGLVSEIKSHTTWEVSQISYSD